MAQHTLRCSYPGCYKIYDDDDPLPRMLCEREKDGAHGPALLRAVYSKDRLDIKSALPGIFPYLDWLPLGGYYIDKTSYALGAPFCYRSEGLAERLGLDQLYIAFSGFWPEKGANLLTRTFKEFECQAGIVRYLKNNLDHTPLPFVVASAGNTANGYNLLSILLDLPIYLVVPESGVEKLMLPFATEPFLIAVKGDYSDAGALADLIGERTGLVRDGGVRNVARRGGLGSVMLHAVVHDGQGSQKLFDHYVQAVGSGTGAIAAWEAVNLLLADGRFGDTVTKIHIAQNTPFTPMVDSWERGRRNLVTLSDRAAKEKIASVTADVLTNRHPAYSIAGGVYDMLRQTGGYAWRVDNYQIFHGARIFRECEGVDIGPAAAVAVDALRQAVVGDTIKRQDSVLLHITGGGKEIQHSRGPVYRPRPTVTVKPSEVNAAIQAIGELSRITDPQKNIFRYIVL